MDRAGLAITTVLATVVLMTEGVVSKAQTWLSVFFIVCTTYQASSCVMPARTCVTLTD